MNTAPEVGIDPLTMLDVSPPEFVSIAREAGFDSVGLRVAASTPGEEPWPMTVGSPMLEETVRRLDDTGIRVLAVEVFRLDPGTRPGDYESAFEAGGRLGARYVTVNSDDPDIERATEAFAALTAGKRGGAAVSVDQTRLPERVDVIAVGGGVRARSSRRHRKRGRIQRALYNGWRVEED